MRRLNEMSVFTVFVILDSLLKVTCVFCITLTHWIPGSHHIQNWNSGNFYHLEKVYIMIIVVCSLPSEPAVTLAFPSGILWSPGWHNASQHNLFTDYVILDWCTVQSTQFTELYSMSTYTLTPLPPKWIVCLGEMRGHQDVCLATWNSQIIVHSWSASVY